VKAKDEIGVAERGDLPTLVSSADIRGESPHAQQLERWTRHIDQMVFASLQLGYEYVAITDHSERALSSRQLAASDIAKQRADIDKVRSRARRVQILHGIEVDIMPDGSLDFDDEQLAEFDIVLASLHDLRATTAPG
jgi:DNA polymerase (family 10)